MATDFTIADVLAWARTKPADEHYDYCAPVGCALAQFGKATGRGHLIGLADPEEDYPELENVLNPDCTAPEYPPEFQTFGGLVKRLEALCPETPITRSNWSRVDAYMADIELASA